jgi:hypothetical protein
VHKSFAQDTWQREGEMCADSKMTCSKFFNNLPVNVEDMSGPYPQSEIISFAVRHDNNQPTIIPQNSVQLSDYRQKLLLAEMLEDIVREDVTELPVGKRQSLGNIAQSHVETRITQMRHTGRIAVNASGRGINAEVKAISATEIKYLRTAWELQQGAFK